jgi:hypothetical protein
VAISGYWWLFVVILLMAIGGYSVVGHWWLLMAILLMVIVL